MEITRECRQGRKNDGLEKELTRGSTEIRRTRRGAGRGARGDVRVPGVRAERRTIRRPARGPGRAQAERGGRSGADREGRLAVGADEGAALERPVCGTGR